MADAAGGRIGQLYWLSGDWDHIRNAPGERCDCPENGRVACRNCHRERHPMPRFTKRSA
jgi:hypothetical protein